MYNSDRVTPGQFTLKILQAHLEVSLPGVKIHSSVIPPRPDRVVDAQEDDHMFAFQLIINY